MFITKKDMHDPAFKNYANLYTRDVYMRGRNEEAAAFLIDGQLHVIKSLSLFCELERMFQDKKKFLADRIQIFQDYKDSTKKSTRLLNPREYIGTSYGFVGNKFCYPRGYAIMRYYDAPNLSEFANTDLDTAVHLSLEASLAVKELHQKGYLHNDLALRNMLYVDNKVLLSDIEDISRPRIDADGNIISFPNDTSDLAVELRHLFSNDTSSDDFTKISHSRCISFLKNISTWNSGYFAKDFVKFFSGMKKQIQSHQQNSRPSKPQLI